MADDHHPSGPRPLRPGDRAVVLAPASPCLPDRLAHGVRVLKEWGLIVEVLGDPTRAAAPHLAHVAGDDRVRAGLLVDALSDPHTQVVLAARGGTAMGRTLARVGSEDWQRIAAAPARWVVGASDVTALHAAMAVHRVGGSVFGPMPATEAFADSDSVENLRRLLMGLPCSPLAGTTVVDGPIVRAPAAGGTVSVLASLAGTSDLGSAIGAIVLLEDIDEAPRRLDRALTQLLRCGWLAAPAGVVVGSLRDCGSTALDVVLERVGSLGVPVIAGVDLGHGLTQRSLPLGVPVTMDPASGHVSW